MDPETDQSLESEELSRLDQFVVELLQLSAHERSSRLNALATIEPDLALQARRRLGVLDDHGLLTPEPPASSLMPRSITGYRILRRLGSGGMGVVWLAEQPSLQRVVALKVMHDVRLHSARARERFRREALAAARLDHPNLCSVYEIGETEGAPFIAMRYVPGRTLGERIESARAQGAATVLLGASDAGRMAGGPAERRGAVLLGASDAGRMAGGPAERRGAVLGVVELVERIARAIHCAHQAGLVHRDLKPDNIVVEPDGTPVVLDFGLAQDESTEAEPTLTLSGDRIGTPIYMAPEQVAGRGQRPDARTDVYALGAVLYECLTLAPPVQAPDRDGLYRAIVLGAAADAARGAAGLDRDLRVILGVAMAPEPERRYASALALAEDLARYRSRRPILAQPAGPWLRARRWTQRNPVGAILLAAMALGLAVTAALLREVQSALRRAEAQVLAGVAREVGESDPMAGLTIALQAHRRAPDSTTLSAVYRTLSSSHEERVLRGHAGVVWRCVFSADGRRVASCSDDGTVRIWDTRMGCEPIVLLHNESRNVNDLDTDGHRLVAACRSGHVRLYDFDGTELALAPLPEPSARPIPLDRQYLRARFSHDAEKVVVTSFDGAAWIWDIDAGSVRRLEGHRGMVWCGSFSPDDRWVLTAVGYGSEIEPYSGDLTARIWSVDGSESRPLTGHTKPLLCAEFSPDGNLVLTGSRDCTLRLWRARSGEWIRSYAGHAAPVRCVQFLPDGAHFVSADLLGKVRIWRIEDAAVVAEFSHDDGVWSIELSPDGQQILTSSFDQTARVHDLRGRLLLVLRGHGGRIAHARFSPDATQIATASYDQTVRLWRAADPEFVVFASHADGVRSIAAAKSPQPTDERIEVASGSIDGMVRLWSKRGAQVVDTGNRLSQLAISPSGDSFVIVHDDQTGVVGTAGGKLTARFEGSRLSTSSGIPAWRSACVAFLDATRFLSSSQNGVVTIRDRTGNRIAQALMPPDHSLVNEHLDLAAHPDGMLFASAYWYGQVIVRTLTGIVVAQAEPTHSDNVVCVDFSPDGRWLVSASTDNTAALWRWTAGRLALRTTLIHEAAVTWAGFSPDGLRILTTSRDGAARLWDLDGRLLLVIRAGPEPLWSGAWWPDGKRILTGSRSGFVRSWPVDEQHIVALANARATRLLSPQDQARVEQVIR